MNMNTTLSLVKPISYPESDGKPMADNTKQGRWIMVLCGNLAALFQDRPDVFIAPDLFWYAVEGEPEEVSAPDVLVVFGRPKGDRGSYKQWEEEGVPVTVAFEVLSPSNTPEEMVEKYAFYERHGVEEYYCFNPDRNSLQIFVRRGEVFLAVRGVNKFVSPRLGIRFDLSGEEMVVYGPDGSKFLTHEEERTARLKAEADRQQTEDARLKAEADRQQAEDARLKAEADRQQSENARLKAEADRAQAEDARLKAETDRQQAKDARLKAEAGRQQSELARGLAERKLARVMELSRKARRGQATAEELQELDQLEER